MDVWHKGRQFVAMLEHKQHRLQMKIAKIKFRINEILDEISDLKKQYAQLNQRIDSLTPAGLLIRCELYKGIRQQGALISYQQIVIHKITTLEQKLSVEKAMFDKLNLQVTIINKKHYKVTCFINEFKNKRNRCNDNNLENEIQELSIHRRKYD